MDLEMNQLSHHGSPSGSGHENQAVVVSPDSVEPTVPAAPAAGLMDVRSGNNTADDAAGATADATVSAVVAVENDDDDNDNNHNNGGGDPAGIIDNDYLTAQQPGQGRGQGQEQELEAEAELEAAVFVPLPDSSRASQNQSFYDDDDHGGIGAASIRSQSPLSLPPLPPPPPPPSQQRQRINSSSVPPRNSTSDQITAVGGAPNSEQPTHTYLQKASRLRPYFPHLKNVFRRGRKRLQGLVDCYDYTQGSLKSTRFFRGTGIAATSFLYHGEQQQQHLRDILRPGQEENDVDMRLLLVTDLSQELIEILGSCLSINPGFFEEHLLNAGWHNSQDDPRVHTWVKRNMPRDYHSIRWYRPVTGWSDRGCSVKDRDQILQSGSIDWTEGNEKGRGRKQHKLSLLTNIFRKSWMFFSSDNQESDADAVFAWEERATTWCKQIDKVFLILILLDPLPWMEESVIDVAEEEVSRRRSTRRDRVLEINEEESQLKVCAFRRHGIREPPVDYASIMSMGNLDVLHNSLNRTHSTASSIELWLQLPYSSGRASPPIHTHPFHCLSLVIERDVLNMLDLMDQALEDLALDILDDFKLRDRLGHWRQVLARFELELAEIDDSLRKLPAYSEYIFEGAGQVPSSRGIGPEPNFQACRDEISKLRHKSLKSSKSFMAAISILESKRAIAEAESVTQLTELAFFFIPLTFSASIFSMQVKELNASDLSISAFFTLAIVITASLYGLRLAIRSTLTIEARRKLMDNVRDFSGVPHGSPIGSRAILRYIWSQTGPSNVTQELAFISILSAFFVNVILLAALWSRPIVRSMKVAITAALCMTLVFLILCLLMARLKFQRRNIKTEHNE